MMPLFGTVANLGKNMVIFLSKSVSEEDEKNIIRLVGKYTKLFKCETYFCLKPKKNKNKYIIGAAFELRDAGYDIIIPRNINTSIQGVFRPLSTHCHIRGSDPLPIPHYCFADHKNVVMAKDLRLTPRRRKNQEWLPNTLFG